ncbi:MAG: hypothetical protein WC621_05300 [Patescibacteria group bacterium]
MESTNPIVGSITGNAATVTGLAVTAGQTLTVTSGGTIGTAAYTASSAYATSAQGTLATNALPKAGGTLTGATKIATATSATIGSNVGLWVSGNTQGLTALNQIGFGYDGGTNVIPSAIIGGINVDNAGYTAYELFFATRVLTTDTAPIERMRIDKNGNVGIGTAVPGNILTIAGGNLSEIQNNMLTLFSNSIVLNGEMHIGFNSEYTTGFKYLATDAAAEIKVVNGAFGFRTAASGTAGTDITYSEKLTILNTGNVGIGTTAPGEKLEVSGGVVKINTTSAASSYATREAVLNFGLSNYLTTYRNRITNSSSSTLTDATINFELANGASTYASVMTLNGAGNVGIGTTAPSALLNLKGTLSSALTGTVTATNLSAGVVGVGTLFTTELVVGDSIKIGTEIFTVSVITDALNLTLDTAYQGATASGLTAYRDPTLFAIDNGDAVNKLTITKSGNVGIGTTAPAGALDVRSSVNGGESDLYIANTYLDTGSIDETAVLQFNFGPTAGAGGIVVGKEADFMSSGNRTSFMSFYTRNAGTYAEKMRINSSGNVGIGTTDTSTGKLVISGGNASILGGNSLRLYNSTNGNFSSISSATAGVGAFQIDTGGAAAAFYINNTGNVGIGTTSPTYPLQVVKEGADGNGITIDAYGGWGGYFVGRSAGGTKASPTTTGSTDGLATLQAMGYVNGAFTSRRGDINIASSENWTTTANGTFMYFRTTADGTVSTTEKMRITSAGNVGIGTTAPGGTLEVSSSNSSTNLVQLSNASLDNYPYIETHRARGTIASPTSINTGDKLFGLSARGYDGSTYVQAARIDVISEGTIATDRVPTSITFMTHPDSISAVAEVMRINSSGNVKIGGTATRATTEGTKHLDIFDGTAPAGTLANGISLYSTAGELRVMDAAGNATLLSPHENINNYWVFDSTNQGTGKSLVIDMELMIKKLNREFGWDFVHETQDGISTNSNSSTLVSLQELDLKINNLSAKEIGVPTTFGQKVSAFFSDALTKVENGVAYMKALVVDTFTVGSPEKPTGITIYDKTTKEPYCMFIDNGEIVKTKGKCELVSEEEVVTPSVPDNLTPLTDSTSTPVAGTQSTITGQVLGTSQPQADPPLAETTSTATAGQVTTTPEPTPVPTTTNPAVTPTPAPAPTPVPAPIPVTPTPAAQPEAGSPPAVGQAPPSETPSTDTTATTSTPAPEPVVTPTTEPASAPQPQAGQPLAEAPAPEPALDTGTVTP